jgi:hypothetical protein
MAAASLVLEWCTDRAGRLEAAVSEVRIKAEG